VIPKHLPGLHKNLFKPHKSLWHRAFRLVG
jgi:hypothetical protein